MFKKFKKGEGNRGFTLIELLVVIAIIGILSSVVLASLNTARRKSRDARRLSDIKQAQLALEMYFDSNGNKYPATADGAALPGNNTGLQALVTSKFLPTLPTDPSGSNYKYCSPTAGMSYHLAAVMESPDSPAFQSDSDELSDGCASGTFAGLSTDCGATNDLGANSPTGDLCYDVTP